MLLLLAVNCSSSDKAGTLTTETSAIVKTTEVGQDKVDAPVTPTVDTGDSKKSSSEEIAPIAKPTLTESEILDIISVMKDEVCACNTEECGERAMNVADKLNGTEKPSPPTLKKIGTLMKDASVCMMRLATEPPQKSPSEEIAPTTKPLTENEILAVFASIKNAVCTCKDQECGMLAMKTMDSLKLTKRLAVPTLKKIKKRMEEMTTCMVALPATPQ